MGIVNVTPDSFSDGGRYLDADAAIAHAESLRRDGADILDVGGESTRPGAERIPLETEQERALPVVAALAPGGDVSIDTMNADTATAAVAVGARIVNDVSGGLADPEMLAAVAGTDADLVLGHWRGPSTDMYAAAQYESILDEVRAELDARVEAAIAAGIGTDRIVIDPGFGFGKRGEQNWELFRVLGDLVGSTDLRVLIGTSRKRFLAETLLSDTEPARDLATAVTSVLAARVGVWGARVHDVEATATALRVAELGSAP